MNEQEIRGLVADVKEGTLSRRSFIKRMAAVGIAAPLFVSSVMGERYRPSPRRASPRA